MSDFNKILTESWKSVIAEYGIDSVIPEAEGFGSLLDEYSQEAEEQGRNQLQLWLYFADQFIRWLVYFNFTLMGMFNNYDHKDEEFGELLASLSIVTSFAASQAISIRKLCIIGQDTIARIVLRSFIETTDISLMIIHDASIRKEYIKSHTFDEARVFWNKHLRKSDLSKFYKVMFDNLNYPENVAISFDKTRQNLKELATQATHSSFQAAYFSAVPIPFTKDSIALGAYFGTLSHFSKRTLLFLCEVIFSLSELGYSYFSKVYGNHFLEYVKSQGFTKESVPLIMFNSSAVLKELFLKYHREFYDEKDDSFESMVEYIFPNIK